MTPIEAALLRRISELEARVEELESERWRYGDDPKVGQLIEIYGRGPAWFERHPMGYIGPIPIYTSGMLACNRWRPLLDYTSANQ